MHCLDCFALLAKTNFGRFAAAPNVLHKYKRHHVVEKIVINRRYYRLDKLFPRWVKLRMSLHKLLDPLAVFMIFHNRHPTIPLSVVCVVANPLKTRLKLGNVNTFHGYDAFIEPEAEPPAGTASIT